MSQLLALEWNSHEIRVAVASAHGSRIVIEHAFLIPWNEDGSKADRSRTQQQQSASELPRNWTPAELDVRRRWWRWGAAASNCVSFSFRPPPTKNCRTWFISRPRREFNELDENWLLDFVPIDEGADGPRTVLAMAIAPAVIRQIEGVCEQAGLKMQRLLLRPCAAASLLTGDVAGAKGELRLLVDLLSDEADLTVGLRRQSGVPADDAGGRRFASAAGAAGRNPPDDGRRAEPVGRAKGRSDRVLRPGRRQRRFGAERQSRAGDAGAPVRSVRRIRARRRACAIGRWSIPGVLPPCWACARRNCGKRATPSIFSILAAVPKHQQTAEMDHGRLGRGGCCCWHTSVYARIEHYLLACEVEGMQEPARSNSMTSHRSPRRRRLAPPPPRSPSGRTDETDWLDKLARAKRRFSARQRRDSARVDDSSSGRRTSRST